MGLSVRLRLATMADAERLLQWRNDSETRRFSLNPEYVTKLEHLHWLQNCLNDPQRRLYIAEHDSQSVGTARVDSTAECHCISWTVAAEYRGKGVAKDMVRSLVNQLKGKIVAEILPGNTASIKVAQYAGLTYQRTRNNIMYYELINRF